MVSTAVAAGVLGLLLGPSLAGLSVTVPRGGALIEPGLLRGRVAGSGRTVLVTGLAALTLGLLGLVIESPAPLVGFLWLGAVGVVLAVVDLEHHRLPDRLVLPSYVVGALTLLLGGDLTAWLRALLAGVTVFAVLFVFALISPNGLGFGDVKLGGLLGLYLGWLGWQYVVVGLLAGFVLGALVSLVLIASRRATLRTALPLGPALLLAALLAILVGAAPA